MKQKPGKGSSAGRQWKCTGNVRKKPGQAYCGKHVEGLGQGNGKDRNAGNQERHDRRRSMLPAPGGAEAGRDSRMGVDRSVRPADRSLVGGSHHNHQQLTLNQRH